MKILQVSPRYYPFYGGIEEHVRNISEGLAKKHKVTVCTTDPSGTLKRDEMINNVQVKRFRGFAPYDSYFISCGLRKYLKESHKLFDVVHAHSYHAFPALYASQTRKSGLFVFSPHYHGSGHTWLRNFLHTPYKTVGRRIFERADGIVCVSKFEKGLVLRDFDVKSSIQVIPNGIRFEEFRRLRKESFENKILLFVGRLEKYKGVQFIIRALPALDKKTFLHIVGEGSFKTKLVSLAKKLNVHDRVLFLANLPRKDLLREYIEADVFILLSEHEAYGISVAEALSAKTPCILAKTSALKEWIDNQNCFGVDYPVNVAQLAELVKFVSEQTISNIDLCSWDDVLVELEDFYEKLRQRQVIL